MEWLRNLARPTPMPRASALAFACVVAAGCTPEKSKDTSFTLALAPDASCAAATSVDLVDHLEVTLLSDAGAALDSWLLPFSVNGAQASLGQVPHEGRGRFAAAGTGPVCGIAATTIFEGTSPLVTFDPDGDQQVEVPVSCRVISPCVEPTPTPTPFANFQPADLVLGQLDYVTCNSVGIGAARRMEEPSGLELTADGTLWVADHGFNRVSAFTGTLTSGQDMTFAVGQGGTADMGNGDGDGALDHPTAIVALSDRLVVIDQNNHRGQITLPIPATSGDTATFAIGQDSANNDNNVNAGDPTGADTLNSPAGAAQDGGYFFVADSLNHRVLRFPVTALGASRPPADIVLGQTDFLGNTANGAAGTIGADTLSSPSHVATDGTRLWVADTGNNRVVAYDLATIATGAPASLIVTNGGGGTTLLAPRGVAATPARLVIADSGNHRVLLWEPPPSSTADPPTSVLGQADFTGVTANIGGVTGACPTLETCANPGTEPTATSLSRPGAVMLRGNDLWVSDTCNSRVLRFRAPTR